MKNRIKQTGTAKELDKLIYSNLVKLISNQYKATPIYPCFTFNEEQLTIKAIFNADKVLDVVVSINDGEVIISFLNDKYENHLEYWPSKKTSPDERADYTFDVVSTYIQGGAKRTDKYIDNKLTSSRLQLTKKPYHSVEIKSLKILGKKEIRNFEYVAPYDFVAQEKA